MKRKILIIITNILIIALASSPLWVPKLEKAIEDYKAADQTIKINDDTVQNEPFNNHTSRAVVYLLVTSSSELGTMTHQGSGVIIDIDPEFFYVVTNYHLLEVKDGYQLESIRLVDYLNNNYYAESVITTQLEEIASKTYDLALLKVKRIDTEINEAFASKLPLMPGMIVHSIGYPDNERKFTSGKLLQLEKSYVIPFDLISHDSALHKGSSGGALLDKNGNLLGINTRALIDPDTNQFVSGYAIPLEKINEYLKIFQLKLEEK